MHKTTADGAVSSVSSSPIDFAIVMSAEDQLSGAACPWQVVCTILFSKPALQESVIHCAAWYSSRSCAVVLCRKDSHMLVESELSKSQPTAQCSRTLMSMDVLEWKPRLMECLVEH